MIVVTFLGDSRPVGVLLGGSGRAPLPALRNSVIPAQLKPSPALVRSGMLGGNRSAEC